jgi:hypothetical protein
MRFHTSHFPSDILVAEAREACERGEIPAEAYQAFRSQVQSAKGRGIPFEFSISEWWAWWQTDDRWSKRGVGIGKMVMARSGDKGPYSQTNVYCATHSQNILDKDRAAMGRVIKRGWAKKLAEPGYHHHLAVRGDGHPRSRAVITPMGRFGSGALAADAHGLTRARVCQLLKEPGSGWRYADTQALAEPPADPTFKLAAD